MGLLEDEAHRIPQDDQAQDQESQVLLPETIEQQDRPSPQDEGVQHKAEQGNRIRIQKNMDESARHQDEVEEEETGSQTPQRRRYGFRFLERFSRSICGGPTTSAR